MASPIINPPTPYTALIPDGFFPGKMIRIQGNAPMHAQRFDLNLQCGAGGEMAGEDVALHASVRLSENYIARNSFQSGCWQEELGEGGLPIYRGQNFEILLLCETYEYKMAVNGQHFCSFPLRIPYNRISHLMIEGDVSITLISFEGSAASAPPPMNGPGYGVAPPQYVPPANAAYGQPPPGAAYLPETNVQPTIVLPTNMWYTRSPYRANAKVSCCICCIFIIIFACFGYFIISQIIQTEKAHEEFRKKHFSDPFFN